MDNRQDNISHALTQGATADILAELQAGMTLCDQPYHVVADKTGLAPGKVLEITRELIQNGIIREITPVFNARKLNYASTLIAAAVSEDQLENIVTWLNSHPGVSHNYGRNHQLNLWFTIALPDENNLGSDIFSPFLVELQNRFNLSVVMSLPAVKMFKLKVLFGKKTAAPVRQAAASHSTASPSVPVISSADKLLISELQEGIPAVSRPFDLIAGELAKQAVPALMTGQEIVEKLQVWQQQGVMRRLSARVRHYHLGFGHNAMVVFALPDEDSISQAGQKLAAFDFVSHCYQRRRNVHWNYDLYAMVHATSETELSDNINSLVQAANSSDFQILNTVREYKKSSVLYFQ